MPSKKLTKIDAAQTSGTSPTPTITPRGLRIEAAAQYSGLAPAYLEACFRNGRLPAVGGPEFSHFSNGHPVCSAYVVLREHLDDFLTELGERAVERAEQRRKAAKVAA